MISPVNVHPYLYKGNYDFKFDTIKDRVDEYVNYARENPMDETPEMDGGVTTVVQCFNDPPHNWDIFQDFNEYVFKCVDDLWNLWKYHPMPRDLMQSWINVHPKGAWTREHHHQHVAVAVAAYLHVPKNSGRLLIKDPLGVYKYNEPLIYGYHDKGFDWEAVDVESGDILFFPGWLTHKTEVNSSEHDRYVMSMNIRALHHQA